MRARTLITGLLLGLVLAAPAAVAGGFETWLPEKTVVYVTFDDVSKLKQTYNDGPLAKLVAEEEVQAFLEKPLAKWDALMEVMKGQLEGLSPEDLLGMLDGQVAAAITSLEPLEGDRVHLDFVLLADVGENGPKIVEWLDKLAGMQEEIRREDEEFRGVTIITLRGTETAEESKDDVRHGPVSYLTDGKVFALADGPDVLKDLLNRRNDAEATPLASSALYRTIRDRVGRRGDLIVYANADELWKFFGAVAGDDEEQMLTITKALGVRGIQGVGLNMSLTTEGMGQALYLHAPGRKTGILSLFGAPNTDLTPPSFVPSDVAQAFTMALDFQGLWTEARRVMNEIDPDILEQFDAGLEMAQMMLQIDVQKDLIGSLGKVITVYQLTPDGAGEGEGKQVEGEPGGTPEGAATPMTPTTVVVLGLSDGAKFAQTVKALMAATMPGVAQEEEYLGHTLYYTEASEGAEQQPCFAFVGDNFIYASQLDALRSVIRRQGKDGVQGLVGSEEFARAMQRVPGKRIAVSYTNPAETFKMLDDVGDMLDLVDMDDDVNEVLDLSKLPSGATLAKYFDVAGSAVVNAEEGVLQIRWGGFKHTGEPAGCGEGVSPCGSD